MSGHDPKYYRDWAKSLGWDPDCTDLKPRIWLAYYMLFGARVQYPYNAHWYSKHAAWILLDSGTTLDTDTRNAALAHKLIELEPMSEDLFDASLGTLMEGA